MYFPKFAHVTKNTPFFPILHVFAPLNDVCAYIDWSWKTTLITWIFGWAWYPPWHSSAPHLGPMGLWADLLVCAHNWVMLMLLEFFQNILSTYTEATVLLLWSSSNATLEYPRRYPHRFSNRVAVWVLHGNSRVISQEQHDYFSVGTSAVTGYHIPYFDQTILLPWLKFTRDVIT